MDCGDEQIVSKWRPMIDESDSGKRKKVYFLCIFKWKRIWKEQAWEALK